MAQIQLCPVCGHIEPQTIHLVCSACHSQSTILPYSTMYWDKQSPSRKAEIKAQYYADSEAVEEAKRKAEEEKREIAEAKASAKAAQLALSEERKVTDKPLFSIDGCRGRHIDMYTFKAVIRTDVSLGSVITNNATDGTKTIYFADIIGIQYKAPGLTIGYIQLETAANLGNNDKSNFFSENTFTFDAGTPDVEEMYAYLITRLDTYKKKIFDV